MRWLIPFLMLSSAALAATETPLLQAMWRGNAAEIGGLLENGADANARNDQGDTPLMMVAIFSNNPDERVVELVELLLKHKADPNARNNYGRTPLEAMIEYKRIPAARAMIRGGAKVDHLPNPDDVISARTALMRAVEHGNADAVDMLLAEGADAALANKFGVTALDWALGKHPAIVRKLIAKGGKRFESSVRRVAESGDAEAMKLLLDAGADPNAVAKGDERTALRMAASKGFTEIAVLLLAKGADPEGALLFAATEGHADTVRAMLAQKLDPDAAGSRGEALVTAVTKGHDAIARMLIEAGADLEDRYTGNWRALHVAAARGDLALVKMMLARKARLDWVTGFEGRTPLIEAAAAGHVEIARALLDAGAAIDRPNDPGPPGCVGGPELIGPPLAWAEKKGHAAMVALLVERGARK
jgi:ankyrin repeat protein